MDSRKRSRVEVADMLTLTDDTFKTPEKRVTVVSESWRDTDFMQWGVEDTCKYLNREGLEEWVDIFKGLFSLLASY